MSSVLYPKGQKLSYALATRTKGTPVAALQTDTAIAIDGERLTATLDKDWNIWGPNGGYVASVALRAAGALAPEGHRPASISVQYLSVAEFEAVDCQVKPVKKGRNAWLLNVALIQKDRTFLQAQVWTTNKVDGPQVLEAAMPSVPGPDALKTMDELRGADPTSRKGFWINLDTKPVVFRPYGEANPAGAKSNDWYRFERYENAAEDFFLDAARSLVLIDTLIWPVHARAYEGQRPYIAPSLDVMVWFHQPALEADWLLMETATDVAVGGLIHGRSRIWTADGKLIATGGSNLLHVPQG